MDRFLPEKIGNPDLFTGRKEELAYLLDWVAKSQQQRSKSTALLSRRKTGKSALLQRLYNVVFAQNGSVIPFYFEIREYDQWLGDFAESFFRAFIFQYLAFKMREGRYIQLEGTLTQATELASAQHLSAAVELIARAQGLIEAGRAEQLWELARDTPRMLATIYQEPIVQLIDEFQYLNQFIFWDKAKTRRANNLAGSYLHTAEYRTAPLLVSGSWVGWLMQDLQSMLPGRFRSWHLKPIPEDEAVEMIYRYALLEEISVTAETVYLMAQLTEGNPFYISALMRSHAPGKDLTRVDGVLQTLAFETLDKEGEIRATWLEYIDSAFPRINGKYARDIVLYLCQDRGREVSRQKLREVLQIDLPDLELQKKLRALLRSDIIEENYFRYRGVQDNIFDKIFRSEYGDDIDHFTTVGARNEYRALFDELLIKYNRLSGEYNRYKGAFAEFLFIQKLTYEAASDNITYQARLHNLPAGFEFVAYDGVWSYHSPPLHQPEFQVDLFAPAPTPHYTLIGEIKDRQSKFSLSEAETFVTKAQALVALEAHRIGKYCLFVFSSAGFTKNALTYFQAHQIAWSDDPAWLAYPSHQ